MVQNDVYVFEELYLTWNKQLVLISEAPLQRGPGQLYLICPY